MYSLLFRLDKCRICTYSSNAGFGRYGVESSAANSTMFAANDARLLLLGLRFDPEKPIDHPGNRLRVIGQSIQTPRRLGLADVNLLRHFVSEVDRWSVFISYQRKPDARVGERLSKGLQAEGVSVFRDLEDLHGGQEWWPTIQRAIGRARHFVLIIGKSTHKSEWVRNELEYAIRKKLNVIPVLAGGSLKDWDSLELGRRHAIDIDSGSWGDLLGKILGAVRRVKPIP
jgi:hypothetical protein